jgi:phage virion morphogenesis protein
MPNNDLSQLTQALSRLAKRTSNLKPTLSAIAAYHERQLQKAFDANRTPEGEPWQPLAASTIANKRNTKPLVEEIGRIPGSRFSEVQNNSAVIGYGDPLAALHDSGYTIPARTVIPKNRQALYWAGARHPVRLVNIPKTKVPKRGLIGYSEADIKEWTAIAEDDLAGEFGN